MISTQLVLYSWSNYHNKTVKSKEFPAQDFLPLTESTIVRNSVACQKMGLENARVAWPGNLELGDLTSAKTCFAFSTLFSQF